MLWRAKGGGWVRGMLNHLKSLAKFSIRSLSLVNSLAQGAWQLELQHCVTSTWWGRKAELYWWDQYYYILSEKFPQLHDWLTQLSSTGGGVGCEEIGKLFGPPPSLEFMLRMAVSTSHVVVGIFLIIYSSIDPINITLPFSLIMCCNNSALCLFPPSLQWL